MDSVAEINTNYAFIVGKSKVLFLRDEPGTNIEKFDVMSVQAFEDQTRNLNYKVTVPTKNHKGEANGNIEVNCNKGREWLSSEYRYDIEGLKFEPGKKTPGYYNTQ